MQHLSHREIKLGDRRYVQIKLLELSKKSGEKLSQKGNVSFFRQFFIGRYKKVKSCSKEKSCSKFECKHYIGWYS